MIHSFFAGIPNTITLSHEKYYQTVLYITLRLLGLYLEVEVNTNIGRIDAVLKTESRIYIIECKLHGTAEDALAQIYDRGYADRYRSDGREIVCIGVAFDQSTRNIERWVTG